MGHLLQERTGPYHPHVPDWVPVQGAVTDRPPHQLTQSLPALLLHRLVQKQ